MDIRVEVKEERSKLGEVPDPILVSAARKARASGRSLALSVTESGRARLYSQRHEAVQVLLGEKTLEDRVLGKVVLGLSGPNVFTRMGISRQQGPQSGLQYWERQGLTVQVQTGRAVNRTYLARMFRRRGKHAERVV
jgi:hypothetical protein